MPDAQPSPGGMAPPVSSSQFSRFPVKPLKIVGALPEEFFPVDLSGDLFTPEMDQEDTGPEQEDN